MDYERFIIAENNEAYWVVNCKSLTDWREWSFTYHFKPGYYREFTPFYAWNNYLKRFNREMECD